MTTHTTASTPEARELVLTMDGQEVSFSVGETLYQVSQRLRTEVPTLCYDDRLDPFGGCRLCVVEVEGQRNPVASCTTQALPGMVVHTRSERVERHRKTLLELVVSENPEARIDPLRGHASQELHHLRERYGVTGERMQGRKSGHSRPDDDNPFIARDYDQCISCYRCVRVCAEREGDYAISVKGRGFATQITVEFDGHLRDSACTFCGQCVQTCPTGALADRKALRAEARPEPIVATRSICPYCGVGCSVDLLSKGDRLVGIRPAMDGPANLGALCVKGQFAFDWVQSEDRLTTPLVRGKDGQLHPATWDEALDRAAAGFAKARDEHGQHGTYAIASGRAPHESAYAIQKFIRVSYGSNYIDNCSRA
ncbi:MAG: (2Fe-2S)-binding protein [Myxococcales bacterium]|nr:(2Fe-2S)-binding protein [Myxococcales bacterium]MCB9712452.1 (2Fe-2S)-binding protein [Myxococcales bacterium]